jgi:hypothetical protein
MVAHPVVRRLLLPVALLAMLVAAAGSAFAITNGTPDDGEHPYVGLVVFYDSTFTPLWRCSGTLLSDTVFLTAGHCTEAPAAWAQVWFDEDVDAVQGYPFSGGVTGTPYTHPQFDPNAFYLYDLGVVVLHWPVTGLGHGVLPSQGILDPLATRRGKQDKTLTAVGYGLQKIIANVFLQGDRVRLKATLDLIALQGGNIPAGTSVLVSANAKTGGTCFGDSGGPLFLNKTNVIVAVASFGLNGNCAGVGGGYRVDQADDLEWLATFGVYPPGE